MVHIHGENLENVEKCNEKVTDPLSPSPDRTAINFVLCISSILGKYTYALIFFTTLRLYLCPVVYSVFSINNFSLKTFFI